MSDDRFAVEPTRLAGAAIITRTRIGDERGFLSRLYSFDAMHAAGLADPIVQINHTSTSRPGTLRGLHFQRAPHAEDKLVGCVRGAVFDVALDLRPDSATFGVWHGEVLSADNGRSFLIPKGFAHGFQALEPFTELLYLHTAFYAPHAEGGVDPLDPDLAIGWPLAVTELSHRDRQHPSFASAFPRNRL